MFRSAIVKLTARCNLDCTYCYMFNQHDRTYTRVPQALAIEDAILLLDRIAEQLRGSGGDFKIILHGGEPTLWPVLNFQIFLDHLAKLRADGARISTAIQTNGYSISLKLIDLLAEHNVPLGISLDGPAEANDVHRVTKSGRGSYDKVMKTTEKIIAHGAGSLISGFLCVANPQVPVADFFEWAESLPVRRVDVLWPMEYSYANPPWHSNGFMDYRLHPPFGQWFAHLFRLWWEKDDPTFVIRLFFEAILVLIGSSRHTDMLVNDVMNMVVVNTDGGLELHDFMRSHGDGRTRTAFNIHEHRLDQVASSEPFSSLEDLTQYLPDECRACPHVRLCGGGFLPGRMDGISILPRRRSVLCLDQYKFFSEVMRIAAPSLSTLPGCADLIVDSRLPDLPPMSELLNYRDAALPLGGHKTDLTQEPLTKP